MATLGLVRAVPSADTLIVVDTTKRVGPPLEKRITISGISAPRLGVSRKDDTTTPDEPYSWEAREFMRKLVIGKVVAFQTEKATSTAANIAAAPTDETSRVFATVTFEGQNLAELLVKNGLAKPREKLNKQAPSPDAPEAPPSLISQLNQLAITEQAGMYQVPAIPVRTVINDRSADFNAEKLLKQLKGKPQQVVVEYVFAASLLRVLILPSGQNKVYYNVGINLSGIRCPAIRNKESGSPEPFALEAKTFVESRILHRDATVVLEMQENKQLFATLTMPQGNIAEALVRNGLAKVSSYTLAECSCASQLCKAEDAAKKEKLRLWVNFTPQVTKTFKAQIVEVASGDTVIVYDPVNREEHRISLASIRVVRQADEVNRVDTEAARAKELLRKTLIGKEVTVTVEYTRDLDQQPQQGQQQGQQPQPSQTPRAPGTNIRVFGSILCGDVNPAILLASHGLCEVTKHRADDPRAGAYEELLAAQTKAQQDKVGRWAPGADKESTKKINDLQGDATRAKAFLTTLTRQQFQTGVVDFVVNGGRMKLSLPRVQCSAPFALHGLWVPSCARRDKKDQPGEPFGDEAYQFTRSLVLQRDVQVEVTSCNTGGTFLGHLWTAGPNKKNLSTELLRRGFATIQTGSIDQSDYFREYSDAQAEAKSQNVGLWRDHVDTPAREQAAPVTKSDQAPPDEYIDAVVTEVSSACLFFLRPYLAPVLESRVEEYVTTLDNNGPAVPRSAPAVGSLVVAQFSADNGWYRAKVLKPLPEDKGKEVVRVQFVDYGNSEPVSLKYIRPIDQSLAALPAQALQARLAHVKCPALDQDHGEDAAETLSSLAIDRRCTVKIEHKESNVLDVLLWDAEGAAGLATGSSTINARMLALGMARLPTKLPKWLPAEVERELRTANDRARTNHLGMFEYGDVADSDEETDANKAATGKAATGKGKAPVPSKAPAPSKTPAPSKAPAPKKK
eukprot:c10185_g1_i1.p1 GENE.c10185_g1_i1~~c10185_g1_i1.p1  ORF type:complete len:978 (+),score=320.91 c10185_g1_i1:51-2936(+)